MAQWPQATGHQPRVQIEFGAKAVDREGLGDGIPIAIDSSTRNTLLSADQASDLGSAAGIDGKIIFTLPRLQRQVELRVQYSGWNEDINLSNPNLDSPFINAGILSVAGATGLRVTDLTTLDFAPGIVANDLTIPTVPLPPGDRSAFSLVMPTLPDDITIDGLAGPDLRDFFAATSVSSRYVSDLYSIELMTRRNTRPGLTWLFGPRFMSLTEEANISAIGSSPARIFFVPGDPLAPTGNLDTTTSVRSETRNTLVGLQGGIEYNFPISQDVYVQIGGRGGVFYNGMDVRRSFAQLQPTFSPTAGQITTTARSTDSDESFLGEVTARVYMDLIPNAVSAYAGFEASYLSDVALAPNQFLLQQPVDNTGEVFTKALTFGLKTTY